MTKVAHHHTITMSLSQAKRRLISLLDMIDEAGLIVLLTQRRKPAFALLPVAVAQGQGLPLSRHGRPVATLVNLSTDTSTDTSLGHALRDW